MRIETYDLKAGNGRATKAILDDGSEIRFAERRTRVQVEAQLRDLFGGLARIEIVKLPDRAARA
jgi:hypothetical protein